MTIEELHQLKPGDRVRIFEDGVELFPPGTPVINGKPDGEGLQDSSLCRKGRTYVVQEVCDFYVISTPFKLSALDKRVDPKEDRLGIAHYVIEKVVEDR